MKNYLLEVRFSFLFPRFLWPLTKTRAEWPRPSPASHQPTSPRGRPWWRGWCRSSASPSPPPCPWPRRPPCWPTPGTGTSGCWRWQFRTQFVQTPPPLYLTDRLLGVRPALMIIKQIITRPKACKMRIHNGICVIALITMLSQLLTPTCVRSLCCLPLQILHSTALCLETF